MKQKTILKEWVIKDYAHAPHSDLENIHPVTSLLLSHRGVKSAEQAREFLYPDYDEHSHSPHLFVQMKKVIERVGRALEEGEKVGVFGDHDVDGISAATLMSEALEKLGLACEVTIPSKHHDGHGLNENAIDDFVASEVSLMITVDCGTSNAKEIAYAKEKGVDTIVVDHHLAPEILPEAIAIINPQLPDSGYPFRDLCGTACVFKVVEALYGTFFPGESEQLKWLLDIVGVGTIADCMPLRGENRLLVKYGLLVLQKTRRLGYQEMIAVGEIGKYDGGDINAQTVAFQIAPRINAAGRMGEARDAFALMRETDPALAHVRAKELDATNVKRRKLTEKLFNKAEKEVKAAFHDRPFIFISGDYPIGLVGIVAGRICHKYGKPVGVFMEEGDTVRGSFRSPEHIHIVEVLDAASDHLLKHGGHARAAGATLAKKEINAFIARATASVEEQLEDVTADDGIFADLKVCATEIDHDLCEELVRFEPYGHGNEEPVLWITNLLVENLRAVGKTGKHIKCVFYKQQDGGLLEGIGFGLAENIGEITQGDHVEILGNVRANHFNGKTTTQVNVLEMRKVSSLDS